MCTQQGGCVKAEREMARRVKPRRSPLGQRTPKAGRGAPRPPKLGVGPRTPKAGRGAPRPPKLGEGPGAECSPLLGSDGAGLAPLISNSRLQSEDAVGVKFPQGCLSLCGHLGSMFRTVRPPSAWPSSPRLPPSGWRWTTARASLAAAAPSC